MSLINMSIENIQRAATWIAGEDTGISSKTIWSVMMGVENSRPDVPYDAADFGRCFRLLQLMPSWKPRLYEVAQRYPRWKNLVKHWDKLENLYVQDKQTELYHRIHFLISNLSQ